MYLEWKNILESQIKTVLADVLSMTMHRVCNRSIKYSCNVTKFKKFFFNAFVNPTVCAQVEIKAF